MPNRIGRAALVALAIASTAVLAGPPAGLDDNVRYLSMGDSMSAGKGAIPVTQGFAYLLYQNGVFGPVPDTTFANAAVPGTWSQDVLLHQVPQALSAFQPHVVTLTVGGNDLERIFAGVPVEQVLSDFAANVHGILCGLRDGLAAQGIEATIIVGNQYDYPWLHAIVPQTRQVVMAANALLAAQAAACGAKVADVFTAFDGRAELYLHYRNGADPMEVHPKNAGYRVIAKAFEDAARQ